MPSGVDAAWPPFAVREMAAEHAAESITVEVADQPGTAAHQYGQIQAFRDSDGWRAAVLAKPGLNAAELAEFKATAADLIYQLVLHDTADPDVWRPSLHDPEIVVTFVGVYVVHGDGARTPRKVGA